MPDYCFDLKDLNITREYNPNSYRNVVSECINEMNNLLAQIAEYINAEEIEASKELLIALQQAAIDLGTYTEMVKGEGYDIVRNIENLCEDIFMLSECLNNLCSNDKKNESVVEEVYASMDQRFAAIAEAYNLREEVLFICLKPDFFINYYKFYKEAVADPNKDVYIMPIPWYKKNALGMREKVYLFEDGYPEGALIYNYRDYVVSVHEPETIYIQYPQDQYDPGMDIFEEYYSFKLRKYTDRLILVPYKSPPCFSEENESFYYSMKFYVTMPGVICADEVVLYDDWLRKLYINKLVEFTGEGLRKLWEDKIRVIEKPLDTDLLIFVSNVKRAWNRYCLKSGSEWRNSEGEMKKIILYHPAFSSFYEYEMVAINKIKRNLEIFKDASDDIVVIWLEQLPIRRDIKKLNKEVVKEYRSIVEDFMSEGYGIFISESVFDNQYNLSTFINRMEDEGMLKDVTLERIVIEISDAYYGDRDFLARQFVLEKKPVMIQNVEI